MAKFLRVNMPDAYYDVPIEVIALSRATHYADEFDNDVQRSLKEDTLPYFESDPYEIQEWAVSNMNFSDVAPFAERVEKPHLKVDYEKEWLCCGKRVFDK